MARQDALTVLTRIDATHAQNWLDSAYNPNLDGRDRLATVSRETLVKEYQDWLNQD